MFSGVEKNTYPFCYRALVVDNQDPMKLGRVRLQVPEIFGDLITDWAFAKTGSIGTGKDGIDKGYFFVPDVGDGVWCEFESGSPYHPRYSGVWHSVSNQPPVVALGIKDESVVPVHHATGTREDPSDPKYPFNRVLKTKSGHLVELDDTQDKERIKIHHKSGTLIDIDHEGNIRILAQGSVYSEIMGDLSERIHGSVNRIVEGNSTLDVQGEIVRKSDTHIVDIAPRIDHN